MSPRPSPQRVSVPSTSARSKSLRRSRPPASTRPLCVFATTSSPRLLSPWSPRSNSSTAQKYRSRRGGSRRRKLPATPSSRVNLLTGFPPDRLICTQPLCGNPQPSTRTLDMFLHTVSKRKNSWSNRPYWSKTDSYAQLSPQVVHTTRGVSCNLLTLLSTGCSCADGSGVADHAAHP